MRNSIFYILGIILITAFLIGLSGCSSGQTSGISLLNKTSGFTLDDCNKLCDMTYDIQMQVDVCQSNCAMVGKEGKTLDKVSLSIVDVYNKRNINSS